MGLRSLLEKWRVRGDLAARMMRKTEVAHIVASAEDGPALMREAAAKCLQCGQSEACTEWLDRVPSGRSAPFYCHNREFIRQLKTDDPETRQ